MKASLKFREERNPLLRAKLPFSLGCIPVSSGIALGNNQDLAIHLGTFFSRGPSFRLAFKPNEPGNPLSLVLKAGLGLWGSPNDTALALTAEFHFVGKGRDPVFTLRVKPRLGDFSVRKDVDLLQTERNKTPVPAEAKDDEKQRLNPSSNGSTAPQKLHNVTVSSPLSNGDGKGFHKGSPGFSEKDMVRSLSTDTGNKVIGSNFSLKIEGLDREWRGRADRKQRLDKLEADPDAGLGGSGVIVEVPEEILKEQSKRECQKSGATFSSALGNGIRGSKIIAHSSLPLGGHTMLNIRWGVKPPPELFQGWDGSLPPFSFSKLPFLLIDKIRVESVVPPPLKSNEDVSHDDNTGYLERGLLPVSFVEENRELAQVASMCYSMKRQLHLLYAENKVLRRAMEEMKTQVDYRGSMGPWKSIASGDDILIEEQTVPMRSPLLDAPKDHSSREYGRQDVEFRKDRRDDPRKDGYADTLGSNADKTTSSRGSSDVSEELKKAIMSAKNSSTGGKNG